MLRVTPLVMAWAPSVPPRSRLDPLVVATSSLQLVERLRPAGSGVASGRRPEITVQAPGWEEASPRWRQDRYKSRLFRYRMQGCSSSRSKGSPLRGRTEVNAPEPSTNLESDVPNLPAPLVGNTKCFSSNDSCNHTMCIVGIACADGQAPCDRKRCLQVLAGCPSDQAAPQPT